MLFIYFIYDRYIFFLVYVRFKRVLWFRFIFHVCTSFCSL